MIYGKNELLSLFILLDREKQWKVGNMAPKPEKSSGLEILSLGFGGSRRELKPGASGRHTQVMC